MYYCCWIINLLLSGRRTAYWHDNIQIKLLCSSISRKQCHQAQFHHSPCVSEPEISVGWVSQTSEEVFFMTRNKKDKSSRCHRKWDTGVWDDGGLKSLPLLEMTQRSRLSQPKRTFITAKENRRNHFGSCELSGSWSPGPIFTAGRCRSGTARLHRWWPSSVNIQIKTWNERLLLCPAIGLSADECRRW